MYSNVNNSLWASCPVLHSSAKPQGSQLESKAAVKLENVEKSPFCLMCLNRPTADMMECLGGYSEPSLFFSLQVQIDSTNTVVAHCPWFRNLFSVKEFRNLIISSTSSCTARVWKCGLGTRLYVYKASLKIWQLASCWNKATSGCANQHWYPASSPPVCYGSPSGCPSPQPVSSKDL